jgi:DNA polymerase sigma
MKRSKIVQEIKTVLQRVAPDAEVIFINSASCLLYNSFIVV